MSAKAALAAVLSLVLATSASAQAVSAARLTYAPGAPGVMTAPVPALTAPALSVLSLAAPGLAGSALIAAPVPAAALAVPVKLVPAALALRASPLASAPARPVDARKRVVEVRIAELKAAFDERKPEDAAVAADAVPAPPALTPASAAASEPSKPDEPPPPAKKPAARGLLGFSRPLVFFLLALIVAQVGVEAQLAATPPLIAKVFGSVSLAADVGMAASIAELAGTVAAPLASKKLGLKKAYLWSTGLRVAGGGLLAGLLAVNGLSLLGLTALFAFDSLMMGISFTTEKSIPAVLLDQDQAKLEKYKAARQTAIEAVAAFAPIATGALVAAFGFVPALIAFPAAAAVSMTLVALTLKLPAKLAGVGGADLPGPKSGSGREFMKSYGRGALEIIRKPALLFSMLAYSFVYAPTSIVYWLLAPAFAVQLAGPGAEQAATAYSGMITGLYSLGAIIGSLYMVHQQRRLGHDAATLRSSMLRWTLAATLALSLFLVLAVPFPGWGIVTLPALALFVFGIPQIVAKLKLESFFQSRAPKGSVADATAVLEGSSSIVITLGLWFFGKMLLGSHIVGAAWLAGAVAPFIGILLLLWWALARASR